MDKNVPQFLWMTEETARDRVIMLQRMKTRLICEWHPVLDVLIKDYERGLKKIDVARDGPDGEDNYAMEMSKSAAIVCVQPNLIIGRDFTPPSSDDV